MAGRVGRQGTLLTHDSSVQDVARLEEARILLPDVQSCYESRAIIIVRVQNLQLQFALPVLLLLKKQAFRLVSASGLSYDALMGWKDGLPGESGTAGTLQ